MCMEKELPNVISFTYICVTVRKISTMEWCYRRCNDKGTSAIEKRYKEKGKVLTCLWRSRLVRKTPHRRDHQPENLPEHQSALKWGQREVQSGSTPSGHTAELPSPVLPGLTGSFAHSVVRARKQLPYNVRGQYDFNMHSGIISTEFCCSACFPQLVCGVQRFSTTGQISFLEESSVPTLI